MKLPRFILTVVGGLLLVCLLSEATSTTEQPPLNLSFMPFDIVTVVPVTAENISEQGRSHFFLGRHVFGNRLRALLMARPASGRLDTGRIRLRADFGPPVGVILADQDGVVLDVTRGRTFQLTKDARQRIEREIEPFVGAVDITTFERDRRRPRRSKATRLDRGRRSRPTRSDSTRCNLPRSAELGRQLTLAVQGAGETVLVLKAEDGKLTTYGGLGHGRR
jgi:hypothetical protein